MDAITDKNTIRNMDIAIVNEAMGIVIRQLYTSIKENGDDDPQTKDLEKKLGSFTEILAGVKAGDITAITEARYSLRKFVEENSPRIKLKDTYVKARPVSATP